MGLSQHSWVRLCIGDHFQKDQCSGLIAIKFYLKQHWDGGKAALGFGPDWIRILVSMATDSPHRVIMKKTVSQRLILVVFDMILFITAGDDNVYIRA